jgi:glutamyl-tRNA synthetase
MTVVTRFAPSPTGFLHIGGARTALFNWLYARHHGGKFLLRVEDTDRKRSTPEAIEAISDGMKWLGLDWDEETVFQSRNADRHVEVAQNLIEMGAAYPCYATPEELTEMRETARAEGRRAGYDGRWRDRDPADAPSGVAPAVRLKAPRDGQTVIVDQVQGDVTVANQELDDMILLRSDGTPTYMLSVVVDDHDMGVTHVIRGDDHLTNAVRQAQIYCAMGWTPPKYAHIPLIHGPDGAKLSKRHGALGVGAYRDMGYLPEAMRNYLLRLGWSHGDEEIISTEQAIEWFGLDAIGKSPARFDFQKLENLNGVYIRNADNQRLTDLVGAGLTQVIGTDLDSVQLKRVQMAMPGLKDRAKTIPELVENARFCVESRPLDLDTKAQKLIDDSARSRLSRLRSALEAVDQWTEPNLDAAVRSFAEQEDLKLGKVAQPLRAALTGRTTSPGIFDVLLVLGREESLARIGDQAGTI